MPIYPMNAHQLEAQRLYSLGVMYLADGNYAVAADALEGAAKQLDELSEGSLDEPRNIYRSWMFETVKYVKVLEAKARAASEKNAGAKVRAGAGGEEKPGFEMDPASVPGIGFDGIAGLEDVKQAVRMKAIYPYRYPELYQTLRKKSGGGILLYGLPGTGKTMIARAIAHETNATFYPVQGSDLTSKWFGETEKNIRRLFEEAGKQERAVIFFDEIESYTNRSGNDAIMGRVVSELLSQMQGVRKDGKERQILFVAATNRPWAIDGAFMRPGRFDELIYVPLPDRAARRQILDLNLGTVPLAEDLDLDKVADLTDGFNGADVDFLCEKAKELVIKNAIDKGSAAQVSMQEIGEALKEVRSSVTESDRNMMETWLTSVAERR